jgi:DNA invertase Pin-like site-specific DNA recombinase
LQRQAVERAAAARGDVELIWFEDTGSGRSWERPALASLKAAIFRGEVGRLYVFKLDRLSRMGLVDTSKLVAQIHAAGCELISLCEGFDFGAPGVGALLVAMLAFAADFEWRAQQERLKAAREARTRAGKSWGRPKKTPVALGARILELRAEGRSVRAISIALKVPKSTVQDCISAAK